MSLSKKIHLREGEQILSVFQRYTLTFFWKYLVGLIFLFVSSFFMFRLFSYGWWGYSLYGLGMIIGLFVIWRTWFFGRANIFVVTNERVVDIQRISWFDETVSSVGYFDIKDISFRRKGVLANIFNYGNLIIQTKSQQFVLEIAGLRSPQRVQAMLLEIDEKYRENRRVANREAIYNNFIKIVSDLPVEELRSIHELIRIQLEKQDSAIAQ